MLIKTPSVTIEEITPAKAHEFLSRNTANIRKPHGETVNKYARTLVTWRRIPETVGDNRMTEETKQAWGESQPQRVAIVDGTHPEFMKAAPDTRKLAKLGEPVHTGLAIMDEAHKLPMRPPMSANNDDADVAPAATASTPTAPLLRYRIQEHMGQVYVGYFLPDPRKNMKLQLIAKTQHRSRPVSDAMMVTRALTTCKKKNVFLLQMVYSADTGAFAFWDNEADALKAAKISEQACILYRPGGTKGEPL